MAYGTRYTVPFHTILDRAGEFRIQEENYSGSSTELTGTARPCIREGRGDDDELEDRIIKSYIKVQIESQTDYAFLDLFTSDSYKYRGQAWINSSLYWQGYLTPDYYSEPYTPAPYPVELLFSDGLGYLKNIDWDAEEYSQKQGLNLKWSLWYAITYLIYIKLKNGLHFTEAINIIEQNQNATDADTMANQTYFDCRRFNDMNCFDVLDQILKTCGNARLWQQEGRWWVVSPNVMKSDFTARRYNPVGYYQDNYVVSPRVQITDYKGNPLNVFLDEPTLTILPAWRKFILDQDFGYDENIFDIYDFENIGGIDCETDGEDYILRIKNESVSPYGFNPTKYLEYQVCDIQYSKDTFLNISLTLNAFYTDDPEEVAMGRVMIFIRTPSGGATRYLDKDGFWHKTSRFIYNNDGEFYDWVEPNSMIPIGTREIKSRGTALTGILYVRIFMPVFHAMNVGKKTRMVFKSEDDIIIKLDNYNKVPESQTIITEINDKQNRVPDNYTMMIGDLPDIDNNKIMYRGGLYRKSGDEYIVTQFWKVRGTEDMKHLVNLIADEISVNHVRPMAMITGSLKCNFKPGSVIECPIGSDRLFILKRFSENMYDDEWEVDMVEYAYAEQGYLLLRSGGYIKLRSGGKIKLRS
ncbi:MAG: hypothetical protein JXB19_01755 [Bacteroidales bacterium]|nr:hypothetical protein [Bacteroidales bacterium]